MSEQIIKIKVGNLVRQKTTGSPLTDRVREDRLGLTGVVINIHYTDGPLAMWSPLTAEILWADGLLTPGFLVAALEIIDE